MYNQVTHYLPESYAKITPREQEIANKVIQDPYQFLLTQEQINAALGGKKGFTMELIGMTFGILLPIPFHKALERSVLFGRFNLYGLVAVSTFAFLGQRFMRKRATKWFGDRDALTAHYLAYNFVKGNNRYEGRKVLKKKPFMY